MNHDAYQDSHFCRLFYKQQLKLSAGLLRLQVTAKTDQENTQTLYQHPSKSIKPRKNHSDQNILYAPNTIISSLLTLFHGHQVTDQQKVDLVRTLLHSSCSNKNEAKRIHRRFTILNNDQLIECSEATLTVNHFYYSAARSKLLTERLVEKLWVRHSSMAKEIRFYSDEKINFGAMQTINWDVDRASSRGQFSPMLRNFEYINLLLAFDSPNHSQAPELDRGTGTGSGLKTMLVNTVHFCGSVWSRRFDLSTGPFTRSDGSVVSEVEYLVKCRRFRYTTDKATHCQLLKINSSAGDKLSLVLLLPDRTMSMEHFLRHHLSYRTLKRFLRKLMWRRGGCRKRVSVRFPKFSLSSSRQLARPIQELRLREFAEKSSKKKFTSSSSPPLDEQVVLLQKAICEVTERGVGRRGNRRRGLRIRLVPRRLKRMFQFRTRLRKSPKHHFTADRPFLFLLLTTGKVRLVQMAGVLEDPSTSAPAAVRQVQQM